MRQEKPVIREMEVKTELLREKERAEHASYIAELKAFIKDAPIQGTVNFIKYLESPEGQAFLSSNPTRQELDALHGRYYRRAVIPTASSASMSRSKLLPSKQLPSKQQRREILRTASRERWGGERVGKTMGTLYAFGTKEGLRRLQASDPEVAAHVKRILETQEEK